MTTIIVMDKTAGEEYVWLVVDVTSKVVLERFPAGCVHTAHDAMDRYNAEAEVGVRE